MAWTLYSFRMTDSRADSDADYRIIGKWISDRLTDLGWGKTADTGQIDWTTATRPGAPTANTIGGYEIRVSSGTATDVYLKISYGLGYNTSCFGLWLHSGEGSDGAGALTGDTALQAQMGTAIHTASPYDTTWIVAGDADNFQIAAPQDQTPANGFLCGIQRSCDANGADTNDGWLQYGCGYSSVQYSVCRYVAFTGGAANADNFGIMNVPRTMGTSASPILFLPLYAHNGTTYFPMRDIMGQNWGNVYGKNDVYNYGATRRYMNILGSTSTNLWGFTHPSTVYVGIRVS